MFLSSFRVRIYSIKYPRGIYHVSCSTVYHAFRKLLEYFHSRRWGSSLPGLCTLDPPLKPQSTWAEIFQHMCLQSHLQTSPPIGWSKNCQVGSSNSGSSVLPLYKVWEAQKHQKKCWEMIPFMPTFQYRFGRIYKGFSKFIKGKNSRRLFY